MSSEEMRVELEAFVNTGLREGWCGWPLKEQGRVHRAWGVLHVGPIRFWQRLTNRAIPPGERLQAIKARGRYCVEN